MLWQTYNDLKSRYASNLLKYSFEVNLFTPNIVPGNFIKL